MSRISNPKNEKKGAFSFRGNNVEFEVSKKSLSLKINGKKVNASKNNNKFYSPLVYGEYDDIEFFSKSIIATQASLIENKLKEIRTSKELFRTQKTK